MLSGTATGGLGGRFVAAERSKSSRLEPLKAGVPKFSRRGSLDSNWESAFNSAVCASNRLQCEPEVTSSGRDEEAAGLQHSPVPQWLSSAVPDMPALSGQKGWVLERIFFLPRLFGGFSVLLLQILSCLSCLHKSCEVLTASLSPFHSLVPCLSCLEALWRVGVVLFWPCLLV